MSSSAGALLFDTVQGFWMIHSVPHFPPPPEHGYSWPSSGKVYGQTAFCITYKYHQLPLIGKQKVNDRKELHMYLMKMHLLYHMFFRNSLYSLQLSNFSTIIPVCTIAPCLRYFSQICPIWPFFVKVPNFQQPLAGNCRY